MKSYKYPFYVTVTICLLQTYSYLNNVRVVNKENLPTNKCDKQIPEIKPNDEKVETIDNDQKVETKRDDQKVNDEIKKWSVILDERIKIAKTVSEETNPLPGCDTNRSISNSCDKTCLRLGLSDDNAVRISQLITTKSLQLTHDAQIAIDFMRSKVSWYNDNIFLTAASSNHYYEAEALLKNLHQHVIPQVKNYTLIYYDLGLTSPERKRLEKYCKCIVVYFPFHLFPPSFKRLRCYEWKPFIIKAHVKQGNVLMYMDASIRFHKNSDVLKLLDMTKERGFLLAGPSEQSPFRTSTGMYHFFGDEACSYLQFGQCHSGFMLYKRDEFTDRIVLEPFAACSWNRSCVCLGNMKQRRADSFKMADEYRKGGKPVYGLIHRYDQSSISLIAHKVYYRYYKWVFFDQRKFKVSFERGDQVKNFFPPL